MPAMPRRRLMLAALVGLITLAGALTSRGRDAGNQPAQPWLSPGLGQRPACTRLRIARVATIRTGATSIRRACGIG